MDPNARGFEWKDSRKFILKFIGFFGLQTERLES